ncbi:MAG: DUF1127 domain-containing protein [Proteobacteria bacterium]|nr:DUF1127 domain-containing protein [Pseudomonadota bacterium]
MSTTYQITRRNRAARARAFVTWIGAIMARISDRQRATTTFTRMSDHQLRDIGISRAEIAHAAQKGRDF